MDLEAAKERWGVRGVAEAVEDEILGEKVLEIAPNRRLHHSSNASISGEYAVEALVRLNAVERRAGYAALRCGIRLWRRGEFPTYSVVVSRSRHSDRGYSVSAASGSNRIWDKPQRRPGEPDPFQRGIVVAERYPLDKISPLWDEAFRIPIENDMAAMPLARDVWRRLRIEAREDTVQMYHNGLLIAADRRRAQSDGRVSLTTQYRARIASLTVRRLEPEAGPFVPVSIEDMINASGFVDCSSLPPVGQKAEIAKIPFIFPTRSDEADHIDVGRSIFRYRLGRGYADSTPRTTWPDIGRLDPARIRLRVPPHAYNRIWIVTACDSEPNSTPVLTVRFYKPAKGWPLDSAVRVPVFSAQTDTNDAQAVPVKMVDGQAGRLWVMPIDIDAGALASDFREETALHVELTKEVKDFRAFPDPMFYGSYQAGLPSAVRIYAMTFEKAPVALIASGNRNGNVYPFPQQPVWVVAVKNQTDTEQEAKIRIETSGPLGTAHRYTSDISVPAGPAAREAEFALKTQEYGRYEVKTTVTCGDDSHSRTGSMLVLPPDTRRSRAANARWGLWCWRGGHGTNPNAEENLQIMRAVGSRVGGGIDYQLRRRWGLAPNAVLAFRSVPAWAKEAPYDPEEYKKFSEECGRKVLKYLEKTPDLQYVSMFAEHSISLRVSYENPPRVFGEPWFEYTDAEKASIRSHYICAKAAHEGVKEAAPKVKFLFGHCTPQFAIPFMMDNYPKDLFDGYGVDSPQFERMPERPVRAVECNQMFFLKEAMEKHGYDKELVHVESYFPTSHPLALGHRTQADYVVRTAVLSLALGSDRFYACWTLHDCEGYWGSQHYGCIGLISRRPEYNAKPAAAAFATMTQMLDTAQYDGYVPTGSRTAYCVRFKERGKWTYCLWTIRGSRPIDLHLSARSSAVMIGENGNEAPLVIEDGEVTVTLTPTPIWVVVTGATGVEKAEVSEPAHPEEPGPHRLLLSDFEKGDWNYSEEPDTAFAENHFDVRRLPGPMEMEHTDSTERESKTLRVALTEAPEGKPLVGWYGIFKPRQPLPIPGKARALGILANGNSGWGRIVYEIEDANAEIFQSIGTKEDWNCDDTHSWSYFNFDGWRYMEFPLPSHSPGDNYREKDTPYWSHSADGIVDLPIKLNKFIIEMQSHQIYVDEMLPVENLTIELDDLMAVYESQEMKSEVPVRLQRAAADLYKPKQGTGAALPNPIADLAETGVGAPTQIVKLYPPETQYDGTRIHVSIKPVEGAQEYQIWVSAYSDGRGATAVKKGQDTEPLVTRLKPYFPLYLFVTYTDADGKQSKPSPPRKLLLKDEFPMK